MIYLGKIVYLNVRQKYNVIDFIIIEIGIFNHHVITIVQNILKIFKTLKIRSYKLESVNIGKWIF